MEEFNADFAFLAREIKRIYCDQKAKALRKASYKPDSRNSGTELWMKVAELCHKLGARPEDFVTAAFEFCSFPSGPFANNLHGKAMVNWYEKYLSQKELDDDVFSTAKTPAEFEIKNKLATLRTHLFHKTGSCDPDNPEVMKELRSSLFGLDPLACILLGGADEEVVNVHRDAADEILSARPDIIRTLKEMGVPINLILQL